jgi:hypothetical protein
MYMTCILVFVAIISAVVRPCVPLVVIRETDCPEYDGQRFMGSTMYLVVRIFTG